MMSDEDLLAAQKQADQAELLKYALVIVSSLPFMILYLMLQKYFVKGIMVGAIKG
jgi:putative aldouronate transport system permease protein